MARLRAVYIALATQRRSAAQRTNSTTGSRPGRSASSPEFRVSKIWFFPSQMVTTHRSPPLNRRSHV
uniref:Putative secreted protein n=1 Tax=Anopheles triannulatus TaxID=58253 RepID=A0A2M4B752_9DIPT